GMELHADKPGMVGVFDDFGQHAVRRHAGEAHAVLFEPRLVPSVDLVTMAVALGNIDLAVNIRHATAAFQQRRIGAKPHGAAEVAADAPLLQLVALEPFRHQADYGLRRRAEFAGVRLGDAAQVSRRLDHRHLHAEADAEIGHVALAGELRRTDLAFGAALAEPAGHQDAVDMPQERRRILALEHFAFDPVEIDLDLVGDAPVGQRLDQRLIGILEAGVLADDRDGHGAFGVADAFVD